MELKKGYKLTELGVIPEDWDEVELSVIVDQERPISYGIVQTGPQVINGVKCIRVVDLINGGVNEENLITTSNEISNSYSKTLLKEGDIVMALRGKIGELSIIDKTLQGANLTRGVALIAVKSIYYNKYIRYQINSPSSKRLLENRLSGSALKELSLGVLRKVPIILPPTLAEQTAIATALSDMDDLITSLSTLIQKKKAIKYGVMQQLLKPKEEWVVKKLNEVCWFQEGPGLRNWQFTKSGIKVINVTNLENGVLNLERTERHISLDEFHKMYGHFEIDEKDIVVASSGNSYGKVAVVRKQDLPLLMNTSVIRFKPLDNLDYNFLLTFLKSYSFKNQIDLLITGGAQPNFGPYHLDKITISMPDSKGEQFRIANILLDMDNEIQSLEQNLSKYQLLKQGMMQELLTGKTRLV